MSMFHACGPEKGTSVALQTWDFAAGGLLFGLFLMLLASCGGPEAPEEVYQHWLSSLERGDLEAAFETLSEASQQRLAEAEDLWIARSGSDYVQKVADPLVPEDAPAPRHQRKDLEPGFLLFRRLTAGPGFGGLPPLPPGSSQQMKSVKIDGAHAVVTVQTPLGESKANLVQTSEGWRVALKLPPALP